MEFRENDVVYAIPSRYWMEDEPVKCVVIAKITTNELHLFSPHRNDVILVYSHGEMRNICVDRQRLFFDREECKAAIKLYRQIHTLYTDDELAETRERSLSATGK